MLLDAEVAILCDSVRSHGPAGVGASQSSLECCAYVLVSRATGLPRSKQGGDEAVSQPSTFVAAKALRDASNGSPAQAVTRVVKDSCNPVWCAALCVQCCRFSRNIV